VDLSDHRPQLARAPGLPGRRRAAWMMVDLIVVAIIAATAIVWVG
jgi:hypothetical protein